MSCYITECDGDVVYVCRSDLVKARKEYTCSYCHERVILPGCTYEYSVAFFDGGCGVSRVCMDCKSVEDALFCHGAVALWDDLYYLIENDDGDFNTDAVLKMTDRGKEMFFKLVERIWSAMETEYHNV